MASHRNDSRVIRAAPWKAISPFTTRWICAWTRCRIAAARSGAAIMGQLGLHEFIAHSAAQFVDMGEAWANDLTKLAQLRAALRMRWMESPGRRPEVIAAEFTLALRRMWRRW